MTLTELDDILQAFASMHGPHARGAAFIHDIDHVALRTLVERDPGQCVVREHRTYFVVNVEVGGWDLSLFSREELRSFDPPMRIWA